MRRLIALLCVLLMHVSVFAQTMTLIGVNYPLSISGHSVTGNFGGTAFGSETQTGNGGLLIFTPFIPLASSTVANLGSYVGSPASSTWGLALYGSTVFSITSVANASGGSTVYTGTFTGCAANACSGTSYHIAGFTDYHDNGLFTITASTATTLTATNSVGVAETPGVAAQALAPGALICSNHATSTRSAGFFTQSTSGCGTLTAGNVYWVGQVTSSNAEAQGTSGVNSACPYQVSGLPLTSVWTNSTSVSANAFPDPAPSLATTGNTPPDGCYTAYAALTYTSTNTYDIISTHWIGCDVLNTCIGTFVPFAAGHTLIAINFINSNGAPITSYADSASDTMTKVGACPGVTSGYEGCIYYTAASTGVNTVTVGLSCACSSKSSIVVLEVAKAGGGTLTLDQSEYDTAYITTGAFTSGNTAATAQATEFAVGGVINFDLQNQSPWPTVIGIYTASGGWTVGESTGGAGTSPNPYAFFTKTLSSTGTQNLSGTFVVQGASPTIHSLLWLATFF